MEQASKISNPVQKEADTRSDEPVSEERQPFTEPKLTFVVPTLVKQGNVSEITAGFIGPFYP